jgi:predicted cupin superfamily sugar epimerase
MSSKDADGVIAALGLEPHPEGGYYRETWADETGSAIYFLLRQDEPSAWHRVIGRTEIWHYYAGAPIGLLINERGPDAATASTVELGADLEAGQRPQAVVPAGAWQCARTRGRWTLVGCTVTPPFSFDAFELAPPSS